VSEGLRWLNDVLTALLKIDMDPNYSITVTRPDHVEALADIELAASTRFDGYAPESVPLIVL
jgi:hypothetical protein